LKKQKECLEKDNIEFKYVELEKPSMKVKIPHSHDESVKDFPKYQFSTKESKRMRNSMYKTNSF